MKPPSDKNPKTVIPEPKNQTQKPKAAALGKIIEFAPILTLSPITEPSTIAFG